MDSNAIMQKMAVIFDDPEQKLLNEISEINKNRYQNQMQRLNELKEQQEDSDIEIQKQKKLIEQLEKSLIIESNKSKQYDEILKQYESEGKSLSDESKKYIIQITQLSEKVENIKKQYIQAYEKQDAMEREQQQQIKDLENWSKNSRNLQNELQKKDQKQIKLLEELTQVKIQQQEVKQIESNDDLQKLLDKLLADNKRLLKQRQEVVAVFKKQAKIIEILKKQKLHLQTSTSLDLTEQDFAKIVDFSL
ncbi:unnamed protein product (macronuclear) [Paramecium tetraurelia]|uniref:DUF4201 domain-containing protein n=1 Tax=Paramecium tetraurelia TaxID=5888 RepID=A0CSD9_PARTE|nr:uncharacterized protein GSPATT00009978001 [Paramecium tetraurelia]CAK73706.1 unnamed protein product [Paramecium tetraurelia]|eukprot:XP_001441103.1 hypothetical protein (macronuclear) [Paramecium tetraurelia strain d4-2]